MLLGSLWVCKQNWDAFPSLGKERQLGGARCGGLVLLPDSPGKALQLPVPDFSAGNGTIPPSAAISEGLV